MRKFILMFSLIVVFSCSACSNIFNNHNDTSKTIRDLTPSEMLLKESSNEFGLALFKKIAATATDQNLFISPLSVSLALGMTVNGSAGTTLSAMQTTLGFDDLTRQEVNKSYQSLMALLTGIDSKVIFEIANSIWCRAGFAVQDSFINTNEYYFDALVRSLDFGRSDAADIINTWVRENTKNKIEKIVNAPIPADLVMFLINAIYFKGSWTYEFDPEQTETAPFYQTSEKTSDCQLMTYQCELPYFSTIQFQAVDLPYGDGAFRMMVILPTYDHDIDEFIAGLDYATWNAWLDQLEPTEINLYLPKFKMEYENELKDELSAMGMAVAFDPNAADFSKINPEVQLYISKVKHKTFVDVNEEGTEAAAVTSVEVALTSVGGSGPTMRVDRPFVFAIHEINSGTILFIGKIVKPEYEE